MERLFDLCLYLYLISQLLADQLQNHLDYLRFLLCQNILQNPVTNTGVHCLCDCLSASGYSSVVIKFDFKCYTSIIDIKTESCNLLRAHIFDFKCYTSIIDIKTESCNLLRAHIKGNKRRKPPVE